VLEDSTTTRVSRPPATPRDAARGGSPPVHAASSSTSSIARGLPYAPAAVRKNLYDDPHLLATGGLADIELPDGQTRRTVKTTLYSDHDGQGERLGVRLRRRASAPTHKTSPPTPLTIRLARPRYQRLGDRFSSSPESIVACSPHSPTTTSERRPWTVVPRSPSAPCSASSPPARVCRPSPNPTNGALHPADRAHSLASTRSPRVAGALAKALAGVDHRHHPAPRHRSPAGAGPLSAPDGQTFRSSPTTSSSFRVVINSLCVRHARPVDFTPIARHRLYAVVLVVNAKVPATTAKDHRLA